MKLAKRLETLKQQCGEGTFYFLAYDFTNTGARKLSDKIREKSDPAYPPTKYVKGAMELPDQDYSKQRKRKRTKYIVVGIDESVVIQVTDVVEHIDKTVINQSAMDELTKLGFIPAKLKGVGLLPVDIDRFSPEYLALTSL